MQIVWMQIQMPAQMLAQMIAMPDILPAGFLPADSVPYKDYP